MRPSHPLCHSRIRRLCRPGPANGAPGPAGFPAALTGRLSDRASLSARAPMPLPVSSKPVGALPSMGVSSLTGPLSLCGEGVPFRASVSRDRQPASIVGHAVVPAYPCNLHLLNLRANRKKSRVVFADVQKAFADGANVER